MKKNLEILDFEDKKTQGGKRYTRFKTNEGWMSCFDKVSCATLKGLEGYPACVEVVQSGDFQNIKKCYGEVTEDEDYGPIIDKKPEVVRPGYEEKHMEAHEKRTKNGTASMYASYAKDVFCVLDKEGLSEFEVMEKAIALVKQAKEAFE